jgi:isopentenyl phosphate kinase
VNKRLVLIKFGGSLITDKKQHETVRMDAIKFCANGFKKAYESVSDTDFIIATGAGSFAHTNAVKYGLKNGVDTPEKVYGMSITHNSVRRLNGMFVDALTDLGISAFSLSPASLFTMENREIRSSHLEPIAELLKHGCIAVLHGDTILDATRGMSIMSSEMSLQACLEELGKSYDEMMVIYCMDTDGILDEKGNTIPEFGRDQEVFIHKSTTNDVTGSIEGKIKSARKAAKIASAVYLVPGKNKEVLDQLLRGKNIGSRIF